jgi:hypothetical protein
MRRIPRRQQRTPSGVRPECYPSLDFNYHSIVPAMHPKEESQQEVDELCLAQDPGAIAGLVIIISLN